MGEPNGETLPVRPWRHGLHVLTGLIIVGLHAAPWPEREVLVVGLGALVASLLLFDLARLLHEPLNRAFFRAFPRLLAPRDAGRPAGSTWFVLGCVVAVATFPPSVATAGILVLALADPAAALVGTRWASPRLGKGSVSGSLTFGAVSFLVLLPFAPPVVAGVTAVATTMVEALPRVADDNVLIPVVAGAVLWSLLPLGV